MRRSSLFPPKPNSEAPIPQDPGESRRATVAACFAGSVGSQGEPCVAHQLRITLDAEFGLSGNSHWPNHPSRGLPVRCFTLRGRCHASGRFEFVDDTPERLAGFRRGLYVGVLDPAGRHLGGQYYEINEHTLELFYWGEWTALRHAAPPAAGWPRAGR